MFTPSEKGFDSATSPPPPSPTEKIQDTVSSVLAEGAPPGVTVQWLTNTPNTAFAQRMGDTRLRSVSPRQRRVASPSLSVAKSRPRTAELKVEIALSKAESIADHTARAHSVADDAIAEA